MNRKEEANLAKSALALSNSDHLTIYNAYIGYGHRQTECRHKCVNTTCSTLLSTFCWPVVIVRWKNSRTEGQRAEMSYCRQHFLNRTALLTIEVKHGSNCDSQFESECLSSTSRLISCVWLFFPGCEARADEDDGAGRFLVAALQASGGHAVQAADLDPERGADRGALRQRGPGLVHPLCGRAGASGLHGGDAPRQGSGPPLVC